MPHNGYRAFNNNLLKKIFAGKQKITSLVDWIEKQEMYKMVMRQTEYSYEESKQKVIENN